MRNGHISALLVLAFALSDPGSVRGQESSGAASAAEKSAEKSAGTSESPAPAPAPAPVPAPAPPPAPAAGANAGSSGATPPAGLLKLQLPPSGGPTVKPPGAPGVQAPAPAVQAPAPGVQAPVRAVQAPAEPAKRTSDPQAVAVVDAYVKGIGGKEVLAKIKDRATKFRNVKHQATGETVANINLLIKDGMLIREEWDIEGFDIKGEKLAFIQIYNGHQEEGWVHMLGTVSPLDGRTLQVFVWDKQMDDMFCHWEEDGYTLSMAGQGIAPKDIVGEDTPCDIVLVTDFSGRQQMRFFFSKKDALLLKKEWQDAGSNPKSTVKKEQYYKMYRDLALMDGSGLSVKFPLKLEIYLDGDLDTERIYTNVRFNSGLSDKLFDKPEGTPFVAAPPGGAKSDKTAHPDSKAAASEKPLEGSAPKVTGKKAVVPKAAATPAAPPAESPAPLPTPGQPPAEKPKS